jgi:enolase-phosphatase E1
VSGGPRVVLLDVEGTTTPVDFVYRVLFPYAQARVAAFLEAHSAEPEVAADVEALRAENERDLLAGRTPPAWEEGPAAYTGWLTEQDRKLTALKSLQGRIWAEGFARGELRGQVYPDVPPALRRWSAAGRKVAIFSSGSVLAQKLLFAHTNHGDLTGFLAAYFDTTTGPKREADSYTSIAGAMGQAPESVLFVSDVAQELDAARSAGLQTALCARPGNLEVPPGSHALIHSLSEVG